MAAARGAQLAERAPGKRTRAQALAPAGREPGVGAVAENVAENVVGEPAEAAAAARMADWSAGGLIEALGLDGGGHERDERDERDEAAASLDGPDLVDLDALPLEDGDGGRDVELATEATEGPGEPLPHLEQIQAAFGRHEVRRVRAHRGRAAQRGAKRLGAAAFAVGDAVAFGDAPDLHTAAHEAAHTVQQRAGVQRLGGGGATSELHEQHADAVADAVVAGRSAEPLLDQLPSSGGGPAVVQRKALGGALVTDEQMKASRAAARDRFPRPIKIAVLGDPFEVRLDKRDGKLAVEILYLGAYPAEATAPNKIEPTVGRSVVLYPDRRSVAGGSFDESRPFDARVLRRTEDGVLFDLAGDGSAILEIHDVVDPEGGRFDRRRHQFSGRFNGFPTMPAFLSLQLPTGESKSGDPVERVVSTALSFNGDAFTLRARRHGDSDQVVLSIASKVGAEQVLVPLAAPAPSAKPSSQAAAPAAADADAARAPLSLRVLHDDGRALSVDLDGDGRPDVAFLHTVLAPQRSSSSFGHEDLSFDGSFDGSFGASFGGSRDGAAPEPSYVHTFTAYDRDAVLVGRIVHKLPGAPAGAIPPEQDAIKSPVPDGHAVPDGRAPVQGDVPGETSRAVRHAAKDWELRIDGDGDRAKELLLRLVPGTASADHQPYALHVIQLSSSAVAAGVFTLSAEQARQLDAFGPQLVTATDGYDPAVIQLGPTPGPAPLLALWQTQENPAGAAYRATVAGAQEMVFFLPRAEATTRLTDPDAPRTRTKQISTIEAVDVQLSQFRDRFRLTAEKVDSGEVLLGVSALGAEGPVAGFSMRLARIYEPRLELEFDLNTQLSFFARPNWGLSNLYVSSAMDPPKDAAGHVIDAPLSVHRDLRVTLHGEAVRGKEQHTFRVRDGRFVSGWEKSSDNRNAASAAEATGVLAEQARHLQVGEFRLQIDAALDAEIERAVELGWIDGLTAEAWGSLKQDMIFVQAQGAGGHLDPKRAQNAAAAVDMVAQWLHEASMGEGLHRGMGTLRRPAPGEGGPERFTGPARSEYTGEVWNLADGVLADVKAAGYGTQLAQHLEASEVPAALESYQRLRSGVGKWLGKKFELDPKFGKDSPEAARLAHIAAAGEALHEIEGVQAKVAALDGALDAEVAAAAERGLIGKRELQSWQQLAEDMVLLGSQTAGGKADAGLVERASEDAKQLDWWLELETNPVIPATIFGTSNPFTGESTPADGHPWLKQATSFGRAMRAQLAEGEHGAAGESYRKLRQGVVEWIAVKTRSQFGEHSAEAAKVAGLAAQRAARREVKRVPATFIADDSYEQMPDRGTYQQRDFGKYRQLALQLFVWAEDDKWRIRDLSNPHKVWEGSVDYHGEEQPPAELFKELDHSRHLVKGLLHYHLPDGASGTLHTEAKKEWYDWVNDVATMLAIAGLVLATLGAATPLAVGIYATTAMTASMVLGTIGSIGAIQDGLHHGFADESMIVMNLVNIASNLASLGAMGAGKLTLGAASAARGGQGWTGAWARAAGMGSLSYRPLMGIQIATNGFSLLVMTGELLDQLAEIDKTVKDPHDRLQAKAMLLGRFALMGGMLLLSIKGDLPSLGNRGPHIVLDKVNGVTVARLGDVEVGGARLELPDGDANAHAGARWEQQDLVAEASGAGKPGAQQRAHDLLGDPELQRWTAQWLTQAEKLQPGNGRPIVKAPEGAPPEVVKQLQALVDRGDVALHEQAFRRADDVAELREAAGELDVDPRNRDTWPGVRKQLVDKLSAKGGPRRAEQLVARYEAATLGAGGDVGKYASQRAEINKLVPDSELDRIRGLYPEHDVYVTGAPTGDHVEIAVVVPNGTEPALMSALEQRTQGHVVHREPTGAARSGEGKPHDPPLRLRAKVMSEDQFLGMATAQTKGRGAPSYHRLGEDVGKSLGLGSIEVRPQGGGRYAIEIGQLQAAHGGWKARGDGKVSKLKYDPDTHSMYFELHGGELGKVRVEAPLPPRILSAADWHLENSVIGTRLFRGLDEAEDVLRKVTGGDLSVIERELGVALPRGFSTADGLELGLGQLPDGRFVIVRGEIKAVDWSKLPGVTARGHTHPSTRGNDLNADSSGQPRVSIAEVQRPTDVPHFARTMIYPSPPDVRVMSEYRIREHRVFTAFVVQDGFIMKPPAGWKGEARLEFTILDAQLVGHLPDGTPVHRATLVGTFEGKQVLRHDVHVLPESKIEPDGQMFTKPPDGMVSIEAGVGGARAGGGKQPGGATSRTPMSDHAAEARLRQLRDELTPQGKAELDELSSGAKPEETWEMLQRKGDPKRFLEGRAAKKAGAEKAATDKAARIAATAQRLRDTGFLDSPLVKADLARGDADGVRGKIAEHLAKLNTEAEFHGKPDHVVLDDVDVSRRFGTFKTLAEAKASLPAGQMRPLYELDGAVWERQTNLDVLVLHKREVVRLEEVKSGSQDRHAEAKAQQQKGLDALRDLAAGDATVRLHHHRRTDISDTFDAATATPDKAKTVGPDDKQGFDRKLGVRSSDLTRIADDLIKEAKAASDPKKVDPQVTP
jgi:Domain of unknown function (DUF4157)